jgi:hypothetical protein
MHGNFAFIVVAAITDVHVHLVDPVADQALNLLHLFSQRVAIIEVSRDLDEIAARRACSWAQAL